MFNDALLCLHECRMTDVVGEILNGLRCYFDKALPAILLYKKERLQYREGFSDNTSPSTIYGAEHLLRLFGMLIVSCNIVNHIVCGLNVFFCLYDIHVFSHQLDAYRSC